MDSRSGEEIRTAETVLLPDPRSTLFSVQDPTTGDLRPMEVADLCRAVLSLELPAEVDGDVKEQFDTACNLFVYAWFVYRFHAVSQLQALRTLELALRRCVPEASKIRGLKRLLYAALESGCLCPSDFSIAGADRTIGAAVRDAQLREAGKTPLKSHEHAIDFICRFRNDLAHGEPWMHPQSGLFLQIVANLITSIYRARAA